MFGRTKYVCVEHFPATVLDISIISIICRQLHLTTGTCPDARVEREILEDGVVDDEGDHPLGEKGSLGLR